MTWLGLGLAAGLGALARYELAGLVQTRTAGTRPVGTFVVNVAGSFLLGMAVAAEQAGRLPESTFRILTTGFLGGFTTFSTWMVETLFELEEGGRAGRRAGFVNLAGMLTGGLLGVGAGLAVGSRL